MKTPIARCSCGDFTTTVSGKPHYVHRCSCDYCQRRTGNVFQVSCWYPESQVVSRGGDFRVSEALPNLAASFAQTNTETPPLSPIRDKFCTRCGSTVYWDIPPPEKIREGMDRPRTPGTARLDARGALPVCWPLARR